MRFVLRASLPAFLVALAILPASAQEPPKAAPLYKYELQLASGSAKDPKDGYYVEAVAFGKTYTERAIIKKGMAVFLSYNGGLARWDLRNSPNEVPVVDRVEWKEVRGVWTGVTRNQNFTQLTSVAGACLRNLSANPEGTTLLASYDTPPLPFTWAGPPIPYVAPFFEVWNTESSKLVFSLKPNEERSFSDAALSNDGKTMIAAEYLPRIKEDGKRGRFTYPKESFGRLFFVGDPQVSFWDLASGKLTRTLTGLCGPIALSPDGKLLAATKWKDGKRVLVVVDGATGEEKITLAQPKDFDIENKVAWRPTDFRFAPDGKFLAGCCTIGRKCIWVVWDLEGKIVLPQGSRTVGFALCFIPKPHRQGPNWLTQGNWIRALAFSPNGYYAVGEDGAIRVYAWGW